MHDLRGSALQTILNLKPSLASLTDIYAYLSPKLIRFAWLGWLGVWSGFGMPNLTFTYHICDSDCGNKHACSAGEKGIVALVIRPVIDELTPLWFVAKESHLGN